MTDKPLMTSRWPKKNMFQISGHNVNGQQRDFEGYRCSRYQTLGTVLVASSSNLWQPSSTQSQCHWDWWENLQETVISTSKYRGFPVPSSLGQQPRHNHAKVPKLVMKVLRMIWGARKVFQGCWRCSYDQHTWHSHMYRYTNIYMSSVLIHIDTYWYILIHIYIAYATMYRFDTRPFVCLHMRMHMYTLHEHDPYQNSNLTCLTMENPLISQLKLPFYMFHNGKIPSFFDHKRHLKTSLKMPPAGAPEHVLGNGAVHFAPQGWQGWKIPPWPEFHGVGKMSDTRPGKILGDYNIRIY